MAAGALVSIVLARTFGAAEFGRWSVAVVYGTLVAAVVEGGLGRILLREGARNPEQLGKQLGLVLKGRGLLSLVALPTALGFAWYFVDSPATWLLVLVLVLARTVEGVQSSFVNAMYVLDRFKTPNLIEVARRVALLAGTLVVVGLHGGLVAVAIISLVVAIAATTPLLAACRKLVTIDFSGTLEGQRRDAFWFWLGGVLFWINGEIDQLMLASMAGEAPTGIYAAAVRLVTFTFVIPVAVSNTVIPRLFRSSRTGERLDLHLNGTALFLSAIGGLLGVELFFSGHGIATLVYGAAFAESGHILVIYGGFMAVYFMRMAPQWFLGTSDRVALNALLLLAGGIANVALNLWWIPTMGAEGAAWATLVSTAVLLVTATGVAVAATGPRIVATMFLGLVPAVAAGAIHLAVPGDLPWWVGTAAVAVALGPLLGWAVHRIMKGWSPFGLLGREAE